MNSTSQVDLDALKFQVGETSLKRIPLSPDVRQYFRKPLFDHSIDFDLQAWRPFVTKPKNINDADKPKAQNEISDAAIGQVLKLHEYDVMK